MFVRVATMCEKVGLRCARAPASRAPYTHACQSKHREAVMTSRSGFHKTITDNLRHIRFALTISQPDCRCRLLHISNRQLLCTVNASGNNLNTNSRFGVGVESLGNLSTYMVMRSIRMSATTCQRLADALYPCRHARARDARTDFSACMHANVRAFI